MVSDEVVAPETQLTGPGHPPVFARLLNVEPPSVETCHWNVEPLAIVGVSVRVLVGQTFFEVMSVVTLGDVLTGTLTGVLATEQLPSVLVRLSTTFVPAVPAVKMMPLPRVAAAVAPEPPPPLKLITGAAL